MASTLADMRAGAAAHNAHFVAAREAQRATAVTHVYVVYNPRTRLTKIGISHTPENRRRALEAGCGQKLSLRATLPHPTPEAAQGHEVALHERFAEYRRIGEWFALPAPTRRALERELFAIKYPPRR